MLVKQSFPTIFGAKFLEPRDILFNILPINILYRNDNILKFFYKTCFG